MKKKHLILAIIFLLIILSFIFLSSEFNFKEEPTYVTEHSLGIKESIRFVHISSPLSASSIQVRKINKESKEEYLLEAYQNYDNMIGYTLNKDTLVIFLKKGYWLGRNPSQFVKCDTFHLNINNMKWEIK